MHLSLKYSKHLKIDLRYIKYIILVHMYDGAHVNQRAPFTHTFTPNDNLAYTVQSTHL